MGIFDTAVVGTDGSAAAADALDWARSVVPTDGLVKPVEIDEQQQDPAQAMLDIADEVDADVVVIGRHSSRWPVGGLGGVTRRLLHQTTIPVVIAARANRADSAGSDSSSPSDVDSLSGRDPVEPRSIVAGVGYGQPAVAAATWAAAAAEELGVGLVLLHVVGHQPIYPADSPSDTLGSYLGSDVLTRWVGEDLDHIRSDVLTAHRDVPIDTVVRRGSVPRSLVSAGESTPLLVLGKRTGRGVFRGMLSPRIQHVVARSATTVAVIPSCQSRH